VKQYTKASGQMVYSFHAQINSLLEPAFSVLVIRDAVVEKNSALPIVEMAFAVALSRRILSSHHKPGALRRGLAVVLK
jgi:hypothetical protein